MEWLGNLFLNESAAQSILLLSIIIVVGLALGKIKVKGVSLGVTFVLFVGIFAGHFGLGVDGNVLQFVREFGLILFVYSIGLQVGPGFFSSFKHGGLRLNMLAMGVVLLGTLGAIVIYFSTELPMQTVVGILSGAVSNTPGLGAAQDTYQNVVGHSDPSIAMGYAVAYPISILGTIAVFILLRAVFKIKPEKETKHLEEEQTDHNEVELLSVEVLNPAIFNKGIKEIARLIDKQFVVSRVYYAKEDKMEIPEPDRELSKGDKLFITAQPKDIDMIAAFIGRKVNMIQRDWDRFGDDVCSRTAVVTHSEVNGVTLKELDLRSQHGVNITHVRRAGMKLLAQPDMMLQFGDQVMLVGERSSVDRAINILGDKVKALDAPHLVPIFLGIFLGVLLGSIPVVFPGIPQPVRLGLAGGPMLVAILMSGLGTKYRLITYTTSSANLMLREMGIALFLACVGLSAGEGFVDTLLSGGGMVWLLYGAILTIVPLIVMGVVARVVYKQNFITLMGLLSGSLTCAPALAYANAISDNEESAISYATVYPLTTFLRVMIAQILIVFFV